MTNETQVIIFIKIINMVITAAVAYLIKHIIRIDVLLIKSITILSIEIKNNNIQYNNIL